MIECFSGNTKHLIRVNKHDTAKKRPAESIFEETELLLCDSAPYLCQFSLTCHGTLNLIIFVSFSMTFVEIVCMGNFLINQ